MIHLKTIVIRIIRRLNSWKLTWLGFGTKFLLERITAEVLGGRSKKFQRLYNDDVGKILVPYTQHSSCTLTFPTTKNNEAIIGVNNIWCFWWDGLEEAPELVKICIDSQKRYSQGYHYHVITRYNISEWINLPTIIKEKLQDGKIGMAHFSDIVRFYLLYFYGGLWIDATVFLTSQVTLFLPENASSSFYTLSNAFLFDKKKRIAEPSEYLWTIFFINCPKKMNFVRDILSALLSYWEQRDTPVNYLMTDFLISNIIHKNNEYQNLFHSMHPYQYDPHKMSTEILKWSRIDGKSISLDSLLMYGPVNKFSYKTSSRYMEEVLRKLLRALDDLGQ